MSELYVPSPSYTKSERLLAVFMHIYRISSSAYNEIFKSQKEVSLVILADWLLFLTIQQRDRSRGMKLSNKASAAVNKGKHKSREVLGRIRK